MQHFDLKRFTNIFFHRKKHERIKIAVHFHLYYQDLLDEFIQYLDNIEFPFYLYVTVTEDQVSVQEKLSQHFDHVFVLKIENRGKDIGGFLSVLNEFSLERYDLVLKIHTKKSQNQERYMTSIKSIFGDDVETGAIWRRQLLEPILGSKSKVVKIIHQFRKHKDIGIIGSKKFLCQAPDINVALYQEVCDRLQIPNKIYFIAGTMFWIRGELLVNLKESGFTIKNFKMNDNSIEGDLEHCLERIFGSLAESKNMRILGVK
jgi:O-antigen biosynthesis protein